jgi:hypothetical protein
MKEAAARIKINKPLESAGWRFFATSDGPANIQLEPKKIQVTLARVLGKQAPDSSPTA